MNIGFITPEYPHEKLQLNVGGIGSFINNFACKLSKSGHNVIIFIYNQQKNEVFYDNNIEIHLIKQKVLKPLTWWFNRKHIQNYINKIVVSKKIDIIEAPDWTGITAFMTLKCPLIIRLHGSDTYFCNLENRKQKKKNFYFEKKALFKANKIVGVSNFVAKETKKLFKIYNKYHKAIYLSLILLTIHFIMAQKSLSIPQMFYLSVIIIITYFKIQQIKNNFSKH